MHATWHIHRILLGMISLLLLLFFETPWYLVYSYTILLVCPIIFGESMPHLDLACLHNATLHNTCVL